jgi:hypothetical protein
MTTATDGTPTPEKVARMATQTARLDAIALIGTFGTSNEPGALVRLRSGEVVRVGIGDRIGADTVIGIDDSSLALDRNGRNILLTLPKS